MDNIREDLEWADVHLCTIRNEYKELNEGYLRDVSTEDYKAWFEWGKQWGEYLLDTLDTFVFELEYAVDKIGGLESELGRLEDKVGNLELQLDKASE